MEREHINSEGVVGVGEINTRLFREAQVAEDYRNAGVAGAVNVLLETQLWVQGRIEAAGKYDDTRALLELDIWLGDKIREVQSVPLSEVIHG